LHSGIIEKGWRFLKLSSQTAMVASSAELPFAVRYTNVSYADKAALPECITNGNLLGL
jgi:hypothetical protein